MSYGVFNQQVAYGYKKYTYTENQTQYTVHIVKTNPATMGVVGAVSSKVQNLSQFNPNSNICSPSDVFAKTNGNYLDVGVGDDKKAFYGMFYDGYVLSFDGKVGISAKDPIFANSLYDGNYYRACPTFGINTTTGSAIIRWPNAYDHANDKPALVTPEMMIKQYNIIISGQHCLVHNSKSVFEEVCYSWEGIRIADWSNLGNRYNHHNEIVGGGNSKIRRARTFLAMMQQGPATWCVSKETLIVAQQVRREWI